MSQFYKVLKADPLGTPWTPNFPDAKPIQNWWCQLEGVDKDVSIGKQVGNNVTPGEQIYGDLLYAKSQNNGNEYWKFKSAKVPDGVQRPASTPAQATAQQATGVDMSARMPDWFVPVYNMLLEMNKIITGQDIIEEKPVQEEPAPIENPISPEEQASLDGIFGGSVEEVSPEDVPEGV